MSKKLTITDKEAIAIEALKSAIKALPPTLYFTASADFGIEFWKRTKPGEAREAAKPLRCKRAVEM